MNPKIYTARIRTGEEIKFADPQPQPVPQQKPQTAAEIIAEVRAKAKRHNARWQSHFGIIPPFQF